MNNTKKKTKKFSNFLKLYKLPIIVALLATILIVGGTILFCNIQHSQKDNELETYVASAPKSVEDFTKVEQEILNIDNSEDELEKEAEQNKSEEYKAYENLTEKEKAELEVVPRKEEVPITELEEIKENTNNEEETIPESYNLKDHINIKVENQAYYGLCWAFSSIKSLETNILLHEGKDLDLSELHLDYYESNLMYGDREVHNGGNFNYFVNYLLLKGAVLEEDVPYSYTVTSVHNGKEYTNTVLNDFKEEEYKKFTDMNVVAQATETVDFPTIRKTDGVAENISEEQLNEFRDAVKSHIMKNGSLYTSIKSPVDVNFYCAKDCFADHAVSIVGWDDNYSKEHFTSKDGSKPVHDGAYIILNSWGTGYGDNGYYYISYDDQLIESQISGVVSISMDNAVKIDSIQNPIVRDIISDQLKYYILDYNNDKYITKMALDKVQFINLSNKNLSSEDLNGLEIFSNLSSIALTNNNITDVSLLSKFKRLSAVYLADNNITDVSVLKDLENLYSIDLSGNKNVVGYEYLDQLHDLNLSNTNLVVLNDISKNKNLTTLVLSNNTELDYNHLKLPENISNLTLDNTNFSSNNLSSLKKLYSLSIKNNHLKNLNSLNVQSLTSLDVSYNEITDFSALAEIFGKSDDEDAISKDEEYGYYKYTSLIAEANNISDISILNNIKVDSLNLSNNKITDLTNFHNDTVKMIELSYNQIEKGFETLKNVDNIYLDHCGISNLDGFSNLEKVQYLMLDNNNITSLKLLQNLNQFSSLSVNNNKISDLSEIPEFKNLYNLSLDNNDIVDITPLNKIKTLNTLSISGNEKIKGKLEGNISNLNIEN